MKKSLWLTRKSLVLMSLFMALMGGGCSTQQKGPLIQSKVQMRGSALHVSPSKPLSKVPEEIVVMEKTYVPKESKPVKKVYIPWGHIGLIMLLAAGGAAAAGFYFNSPNVALAVLAGGGSISLGLLLKATWLYALIGISVIGVVVWCLPSLIGSIRKGWELRNGSSRKKG